MEDLIYSFKLITGEEIIARASFPFDLEGATHYFSLYKPRAIVMNATGGLSLGPVLIGSDPEKPIILFKSAIVCYTNTVRDNLKTAYLSSVSNIVLPGKQNLMG